VNPVVVAIDTAWNSPLTMASPGLAKVPKYSSAEITITEITVNTNA
jgi:hypothetical protein